MLWKFLINQKSKLLKIKDAKKNQTLLEDNISETSADDLN